MIRLQNKLWQMKFLTNEIIKGFENWCKVMCYLLFLYWLVDLLPKLPNELSDPIVAALMSKIK